MAATMQDFVSVLFQSRTQAHTWHLATTFYSEHKALGGYYDEIVDLVDGLVESYQGCYGRISGYTTKPLVDWKEGQSATYFKSLYDYVQSTRTGLDQATWVQNQIDEIAALIAETMYQLTLKG